MISADSARIDQSAENPNSKRKSFKISSFSAQYLLFTPISAHLVPKILP